MALLAGNSLTIGDYTTEQSSKDELATSVNELGSFKEIEIDCVKPFELADKTVIRSEAEFKKWYTSKAEAGENCTLPAIDFEKESLLILLVKSGGCDTPSVTKTISLSDAEDVLDVKLDIEQNGYCKMLHLVPSFIVVPKIAADIDVDVLENKTYK